MKFDINNSRYAQLWDAVKGSGLMQTLLSPDLLRMDYGFWKTQFKVDSASTPRNADGTAAFKTEQRELEAAGVLDWRAPLGDSNQRDKKGISFYTGTIPDFIAKGYVEKATEREYKQKMLESYFGNDAQIVLQWVDDVQTMINDADQTMNYMSAQLLSTAKIAYNLGSGITGDVYSVTAYDNSNKVHAIGEAWSSPSAKILDQMRQIETEAYDRWGEKPAMKWQIPYDTFMNVFLNNNQVKEQIRYQKSINNQLFPEVFNATMDMVMDAVNNFEGISPIEIIYEKEKDTDAKKIVHGWADNVVVLRPRGYAGVVRHADIYDEAFYKKYGNKNIERNFARVGESGLYTLMNSVVPNGNLKEWHTDLFVSAVPSLDEFLNHVIVNISATE